MCQTFLFLYPLLGSVANTIWDSPEHLLCCLPVLPLPSLFVDFQSCSRCIQNWKKAELQSSVSACHLHAMSKCCLNRRNAYLLLSLVYINSINVAKKQTNKRGFAQAVKIWTVLQFIISIFCIPPNHVSFSCNENFKIVLNHKFVRGFLHTCNNSQINITVFTTAAKILNVYFSKFFMC